MQWMKSDLVLLADWSLKEQQKRLQIEKKTRLNWCVCRKQTKHKPPVSTGKQASKWVRERKVHFPNCVVCANLFEKAPLRQQKRFSLNCTYTLVTCDRLHQAKNNNKLVILRHKPPRSNQDFDDFRIFIRAVVQNYKKRRNVFHATSSSQASSPYHQSCCN